MKQRDIVIGLAILAAIVGGLLWRNRQASEEMKVPQEEIASDTTEKKIEEKFNTEIPDDAEKAELKDVSEGDGSAIATRKVTDNKTEIAVLADLPDPETGKFYEAWLVKDSVAGIKLGGLRVAKGGWVIEKTSTNDVGDYKTVVVSLEEKRDNTLEKPILKGDF